jgi:predicted DNA-binding ribbon-helix-helix protein
MPAAKRRRPSAAVPPVTVERVQTGVRLEKRILRVLRALAALHDLSLGDLLEGIVLHAFEGKPAFGREGLARIAELRRLYDLRFDASHSHRFIERGAGTAEAAPVRTRRPSAARSGR